VLFVVYANVAVYSGDYSALDITHRSYEGKSENKVPAEV
jgi:hypothetical protein